MNINPSDSNTVIVTLTKNKIAIIDTADAELVLQHNWYADRRPNGKWYACHKDSKGIIYMHRFIMGVKERLKYVDHKNGDSLNNKRDNLRVVTSKQSAANRRGKSKYKGVTQLRTGMFQVMFKGRYIGNFESEIEAAKAYDKVHLEEDGQFAILNFPI